MKIKKNVMTVVFAALVANGLQAESGARRDNAKQGLTMTLR